MQESNTGGNKKMQESNTGVNKKWRRKSSGETVLNVRKGEKWHQEQVMLAGKQVLPSFIYTDSRWKR